MAQKLEFDEFYENLKKEINANTELNLEINEEINRIKAKKRRGKILSLIILIILNLLLICIFKDITNEIMNVILHGNDMAESIIICFIIIFFESIIYIMGNLIFGIPLLHIKYTRIYKENIVKKIIDNFLDAAEYFPDKITPQKIYEDVGYSRRYTRYSGDDYIEGLIENKYLASLSNLYLTHTETTTYRDADGHIHTRTRTVVDFSGIFFKLTNDKSIGTELKITLNNIWHSKKRQEMDSTEFEKYFDVEADDKIKAMQLLTSDVMDKLVDFRKRMNIDYDIVIKNNDIYIRFFCGSTFEANSIENGLLNEQPIMEYYNILKFTYEISKAMIDNINETEF